MDAIQNMLTRRSVKKYKSDAVPQELIEKIVEAGTFAPTGRNAQAPIILAITNRQVRDELSKINAEIMGAPEGTDPFYNAPVVLVVLADKARNTRVYDGSLVMGNMMLATHALGLGGCWIHRAKETFEREEGKALLKSLGIEGEYEGIGNCVIGYPDHVPETKPRKENWVYYVK
ncbi:MAG: nitroreductase family protein [Clostridiales bacterium]|nr:nitroreductase family protein [Clostridiales bacterium]